MFIQLGLIFLIFYCPLAFGAVHISSFSLMEVFVFLLLTVWLLQKIFHPHPKKLSKFENKLQKGSIVLEHTPLYYFALIFIFLILFQLLPLPSGLVKIISPGTSGVYQEAFGTIPPFSSISIYRYATRIGLLKILAYFGIFFLIINWADSKEKIQTIVYALIILGTFEAIYGILEHKYIWWYKKIWNPNISTGTYINKNHFAGLLELTIPIAFGLLIATAGKNNDHREKIYKPFNGIKDFLQQFYLKNRDLFKKILLILLMIIMSLGLLLSLSRGGIIASAISFIFMNILLVFRKRFRVYAIIFLILASIFLSYGLRIGIERLQENHAIMKDAGVRMHLARTSLNLWKDFPIFGTGWGTYQQAYRRYKGPMFDSYEVAHAHNDWIELGTEMGSLGFGIAFFSFLFCFVYFINLWMGRKNRFNIGIGLGGMGATLSLAIHSLTDFNMHIPANALLLSIVVGITLKVLTHRNQVPRDIPVIDKLSMKRPKKVTICFPERLRCPLAIVFVIGFSFVILLVGKPYLAERILPTLPNSTIIKKSPDLNDIYAAIKYEAGNSEYFYQLVLLLEQKNKKNLINSVQSEHLGYGATDIDPLDKTNLQQIQDIFNKSEDIRYEQYYEQYKDDLIYMALQRATQLNPTHPFYHLKLAWHIINKAHKGILQMETGMIAAEEAFRRAFFFLPNSSYMNFSLGSYCLWKLVTVKDKISYKKAFNRFVSYFRKAYQINQGYETKIRQKIMQHFPIQAVFDMIFSNDTLSHIFEYH